MDRQPDYYVPVFVKPDGTTVCRARPFPEYGPWRYDWSEAARRVNQHRAGLLGFMVALKPNSIVRVYLK